MILYLDTQDYIRLFNEPKEGGTHQTLEQLLTYRDQGKILIGYSWATIIEFITKPTDKFRKERVRRGQLVKDICGRNAFPFLTDLKKGSRFPNNGIWLEAQDGKMVTAKWWRRLMEKQYFEALAEQKNFNRAQRRRLKTRSAMQRLFSENTSTWGTKREDFQGFPVSDELIESGVVTRFMKGRCSDAEFEERMNRWLSDPAEFSRIFYDYADKPNLIEEFTGSSLDKVEDSLQQLHKANSELEEKTSALREELIGAGLDKRAAKKLTKPFKAVKFDPSSVVRRIEEHIGEGRADHIGYYMQRASQKNYNFKRSDLMDIIQMCYVPDCDLFRCDKAMADLYRDYEPFAGKLVAKFGDLPARIEERLRTRIS
ncbi:hypothetical protein DOO74_10340 [Rhodobacteraceae bacterium AsT-22]|nr:hypothetical protein DOO74_10340 [Rhodobacteraceae bacterium AsT-22]